MKTTMGMALLAASLGPMSVAVAGSGSAPAPTSVPEQAAVLQNWDASLGTRIWYSSASARYALYNGGITRSTLDWTGIHSLSGEVHGRLGHASSGVFVKGFLGLGSNRSGKMRDVDYATAQEAIATGFDAGLVNAYWPATGAASFSDMTLKMTDRHFGYGSVDVGWQSPPLAETGIRLAGFAGLFVLNDRLLTNTLRKNDSYADVVASQVGLVVGPPAGTELVPRGTKVIGWNMMTGGVRLGVEALVPVTDRVGLRLESAVLLGGWFRNEDSHYLRVEEGPVPNFLNKGGRVTGAQLEAELTYAITPAWSLGVGARYWLLRARGSETSNPNRPAEEPSRSDTTQRRFGTFMSATYRF